jgi:mycothiol synthase
MVPASVKLRRPERPDEDAVAVLVLSSACEVADTGRSNRELADVLEHWAAPGVDLARDAWIALDAGGDAIGYALLRPPLADVCVHPRARGLGLGAHLRALVEERAAERGVPELEQLVAGGNRPAERLLERADYAPAWHVWRLERPLDVPAPGPVWPAGVTPHEPHDERDAAEILALLEQAGAQGSDGMLLALDRFHAEHLADERLDPDLCVLAREHDRLVGAAICETWDDSDGLIVQVVVEPAARRQGIGRALLLTACARMGEHGLDTAVLQVGGRDDGVLALCESVGMRPVWRQTTWRKRLR